ncbi:O-GlcNAc transferase [Geomonas silvestris]|uniref:O-GlcNAc transferase n=1 Tax=Geomonas silvestris TaxID=2740184 RepID=A0A6V8MLA3_9BACT|nr:tetratricopeptide repeat protein [Geomonas silvestris]GFO60704.1 O-GlcNAc transferase [Geomonas silvestris]
MAKSVGTVRAEQTAVQMASLQRGDYARAALLLAVTFVLFSQTAHHGFISYDDPGYLSGNPVVRSGLSAASLAWAFTSLAMSNWHPLTWISHLVDVQLFGLAPAGHHLMSVFLHGVSAVLLYLLLLRLTARPWRSLVVAALFAWHPLHVESVAWAAERKDVLSGLLFHATLLSWVGYLKRPSSGRYLGALALFALGLLAKPMLVTLPVVLLILDAWPLGRLVPGEEGGRPAAARSGLFVEKIPFFLFSLASCAVTIYAQHHGGSMAELRAVPLGGRIANAATACLGYLRQAFWPHDMAVLYPLPASIPTAQAAGAAALLCALTALAFWRVRRSPYLAAGWCWFLVMLLPVLGLIQVGAQSMADRYSYLPLTGIFLAVVWGTSDLLERVSWGGKGAAALAGTVLAALGVATWCQVGVWADSLTLYRHTLEVTTGNYLIMNNYGAALNDAGRTEEAVQVLTRAIEVEPLDPSSYYNLGRIRQVAYRDSRGAAPLYQRAIELRPNYLDAQINLGGALNEMGRPAEARQLLERALGLPGADRADLRFNLAVSLVNLGETAAAVRELEKLRPLDPALAQQLEGFIASRTQSPAQQK